MQESFEKSQKIVFSKLLTHVSKLRIDTLVLGSCTWVHKLRLSSRFPRKGLELDIKIHVMFTFFAFNNRCRCGRNLNY